MCSSTVLWLFYCLWLSWRCAIRLKEEGSLTKQRLATIWDAGLCSHSTARWCSNLSANGSRGRSVLSLFTQLTQINNKLARSASEREAQLLRFTNIVYINPTGSPRRRPGWAGGGVRVREQGALGKRLASKPHHILIPPLQEVFKGINHLARILNKSKSN